VRPHVISARKAPVEKCWVNWDFGGPSLLKYVTLVCRGRVAHKIMDSKSMDAKAALSRNADEATLNGTAKETVTGLVATGQDPETAIASVFKEQGLLISLWIVFVYLLEAVGLKAEAKIHDDYGHDHLDLDVVAKKGKFPYRPSDLFLRV
jgi:hypothetical protein